MGWEEVRSRLGDTFGDRADAIVRELIDGGVTIGS
jgi:hypothetical protein